MSEKLLTQAEVDALPEDTDVMVIWTGGNGPHRYKIIRDKWDQVRINNVYEDRLDFVGNHPLNQVWLAAAARTHEEGE